MGIIKVDGIKLYAFHGCLPEEAVIGGNYIVNVVLYTDFGKAAQTDELIDTIDYCDVYQIVKEEMAIRSKLIEHVAQRITDRFKIAFPTLQKSEVTVVKIAPPMNGSVEQVSVTV